MTPTIIVLIARVQAQSMFYNYDSISNQLNETEMLTSYVILGIENRRRKTTRNCL